MKSPFRALLAICVLLGAVHLCAQRRLGEESAEVQVRVVNDAGRPVNAILRVELLPSSGETPISQVHSETDGSARLTAPAGGGSFRLRITGSGIETTTTGIFVIDHLETSHMEMVRVKMTEPAGSKTAAGSGVGSASEYAMPKNARKEMDAGAASLHASDWKGAEQHFQAAIKAYPKLDRAYYGIGLAKQNEGDAAGAKENFQKAIELNDHNADAERDLGRALEQEQNWAGAVEMLSKSLAIEPNSAASLTLLSIAQIQQGKVDDAIASGSRVHALSHQSYAVVHLVLARAYVAKSQKENAITEYKLFLSEEPNGPRAEEAKKNLAELTAEAPSNP